MSLANEIVQSGNAHPNRWQGATAKILTLVMTWDDGLAEIWDSSSTAKVDPMSIIRMFGGKHCCTCAQLLKLVSSLDPSVPLESHLRVNATKVFFPRLTDGWHFSDVLRDELSPPEQLQVMRPVGFINSAFLARRPL